MSLQQQLWAGPWPAEDGGPRRAQVWVEAGAPTTGLRCTAVRDALASTMVLLRGPGEVFLLRHSLGRKPLTDPVVAWVEQIDPVTLRTVARSPDLAAGPFWPGGLAVLADGGFVVVMGLLCHRLGPDLRPLASKQLPGDRPYNSFVVLADGTLVMKDFDAEEGSSATLYALDPVTLAARADPVDLGEASIARLSADGNDLYVIGARTAMRFCWDGENLVRDPAWSVHYRRPGAGYGWDPVIAGGHCWFLDNGRHRYTTTMRGAGVDKTAVHLWRISLTDARDHQDHPVSGGPRGAVTNPPLIDAARGIALAHDAGNGVVQAFRFSAEAGLQQLWQRRLSHAAHGLLRTDAGEVLLHDFRGPALGRTRVGAALSRLGSGLLTSARFRQFAQRFSADEVVVVDVETGQERGRVRVPTPMQSVVFPAPGFDRTAYWVTMSTIARLELD